MKKTLYLCVFILMSVSAAHAQLTEVEPNDSMSIANSLPVSTSISGSVCNINDQDYFRIILPSDGLIKIYTSCSTPDTVLEFASGGLSLTLYGTNGQAYAGHSVRTGSYGVARLDTFSYCCLAADTFYIWCDRGLAGNLCWNYVFRYEFLPATYGNDAEPDQHPGPAIAMPINTDMEGHLGFDDRNRSLYDNNDYFMITAPTDGTLKVNVSAEAESSPTHVFDMQLFDSHHSNFSTQYVRVGDFQSPKDTVLYWPCMGVDTLYLSPYISVNGDGGYAYKLRYTMLAPVFGSDVEPNDNFANAQNVSNPAQPIEGHQFFEGDNTDDYFRFFKPDTGFLKINILGETSQPSAQGYLSVYLYDSAQSQINGINAPIGLNSQPAADSLYFAHLSPGYYYIRTTNGYNGPSCISYKLSIYTPTIADGISAVGAPGSLSIYPNPTAGSFTIDFGSMRNATVTICNSLGEVVESASQKGEQRLSLGEKLSAGVYFIRSISDNGQVSQAKLVKTR